MRRWIALFAVAAALAACGGDKAPRQADRATSTPAQSPTQRAVQPAQPAAGQLVSASGVLAAPAQTQADLQTMRATFSTTMSFGGQLMSFGGDMQVRASDNAFHMTMKMLGRDMEMLGYLPDMYINVPGEGWKHLDLSGLGINFDQLEELAKNRGFFDLKQLLETLGDVRVLDDEAIDGKAYKHYHADTDFAGLASQLPGGLVDQAVLERAKDAIGGVSFDFFIDPDTNLPRRTTFNMQMDLTGAGNGGMEMTFDILEYNGPVDIPARPTNAEELNPADLGR